MRHSDLFNPDAVIDYIYGLDATNSYKNGLFVAYYHYLKSKGLPAKLIILKPDTRPITLPTPEQINTLLSNAPLKLRVKLRLMAENGLRPIEVLKLTVKDVDFQKSTVAVRTAKRGRPRLLKISEKLRQELEYYIQKYRPKDKLFPIEETSFGKSFRRLRDKIAEMHGLSYKNIRLYDLRHYYATMLYIKTRDILYVSRQLGHTSLQHTLKYIHLSKQLTPEKMQYVCKVADNVEEAKTLIEQGFEYVAEFNGKMLFRKLKLP